MQLKKHIKRHSKPYLIARVQETLDYNPNDTDAQDRMEELTKAKEPVDKVCRYRHALEL